jgi:hypothetical protein
VEEVEAVENLGGLLGQVLALDMISQGVDRISLPGAVPKFGKPTTTPSSNKAAIVLLSKAMVADMPVLRLGTAVAPSRQVIRKPPAILRNNHRITTTLSTIKVNTPSNSKSALLPFNASGKLTSQKPMQFSLCDGRHSCRLVFP